jgi:DNA-binding XRE family transcriptional regulator
MDTGGHKYRVRHLFLKEHREAKGMSAEDMGRKLGMERESVYRLEREAFTRLNPKKQLAYAKALNIEPAELWRPPGHLSLDSMVADSSADVQALAADIVRRLVNKG